MAALHGVVQLKNWTPRTAARAARQRVDKINLLLTEIASLYGDVDQYVVEQCDSIRDHCVPALSEAIEGTLEGRER